MEQIRISAKNLGLLRLKNLCIKCFWLKLHLKFKLPYQIFPGIFSSIDSHSKKITNYYYEKYKKFPPWLCGYDYRYPLKTPSFNKFQCYDKENNVLLTGVPDEMIQNNDDTITIIDYKTARFTAYQDELLPIYQVQLNGYKYICENIGLGKVSKLLLIYYEPYIILRHDDIDDYIMKDGFKMEFPAHILEVKIDNSIPLLLKKVRDIYNLIFCPPGKDNCKDCKTLDEISLLQGKKYINNL